MWALPVNHLSEETTTSDSEDLSDSNNYIDEEYSDLDSIFGESFIEHEVRSSFIGKQSNDFDIKMAVTFNEDKG